MQSLQEIEEKLLGVIGQENTLMKGGGNNENKKDETNDGILSIISSGKDGVLSKENKVMYSKNI